MKQVVVAAFPQATMAHLARVQLESQGIEAWVDNEHFSSVYPLPAGMASGVQLKVWEQDAEAAAEYMRGLDEAARKEQEVALRACPQCHSANSRENGMGRIALAALTMLTCGMYLPLFYWRWACRDCGYRW